MSTTFEDPTEGAEPPKWWQSLPPVTEASVTDLCFECGHTRDSHFEHVTGFCMVPHCPCRGEHDYVIAGFVGEWDPLPGELDGRGYSKPTGWTEDIPPFRAPADQLTEDGRYIWWLQNK